MTEFPETVTDTEAALRVAGPVIVDFDALTGLSDEEWDDLLAQALFVAPDVLQDLGRAARRREVAGIDEVK